MKSVGDIEDCWLAAPDADAEEVSQCCMCAEPICIGESYWDTVGGDICCECMEKMTAAEFLTDVCCEHENIAKKDWGV